MLLLLTKIEPQGFIDEVGLASPAVMEGPNDPANALPHISHLAFCLRRVAELSPKRYDLADEVVVLLLDPPDPGTEAPRMLRFDQRKQGIRSMQLCLLVTHGRLERFEVERYRSEPFRSPGRSTQRGFQTLGGNKRAVAIDPTGRVSLFMGARL